jgi:hypothetical protein
MWQSHAPAGTAKFTGVLGCEAIAKALSTGRTSAAIPAIPAVIRISRRDGIDPPIAPQIDFD